MNLIHSFIASTLPIVPKPVVRRLSSRYIAGETREQAFAVIRRLNADGMMATVDILGEFVSTRPEAERAAAEYRETLAAIREAGIDSNVSIKLTQIGLKIDVEFCHRLMRTVVAEAAARGNFVRIDMEDSSCTEDTLAVYERLRAEFPNVGCAIQAYMKRSEADVRKLAAARGNVRLCKGIYVEPAAIAFKDPIEINRSFDRLLRDLLSSGAYAGIATHDARLVDSALALIAELRLPRDAYEFQMLLGVTESLRARILAAGHRLRVYVPFGTHWYPYSVRRLKENPRLAGNFLKGLLNGGR